MKIRSIIVICFLLVLSIGEAQECKSAIFFKEGSVLTYTDYNKKGRAKNTNSHETTKVIFVDGGIVAEFKTTLYDLKGKEQFSSNYGAGCKNGLFTVDMLRFFDMGKLSEHNDDDIELKIDGSVISFPVEMNAGDELEDGDITIKVNKNDFTLVTMTFDVFNRKVHENEEITTAAGTFDCQVVTFDFESKFGILKIRGSGKEWYLDDKAVVRSESYNKKGKLIGYHELTKIE
ncbi:TapB family protein [Spongiivirga citrea]|uniref:DUF3108 domain-containing protein n=1 Tax=Spongiivirga citrea TaxID=1481457 RepID=A0A6M0CDJ5_9FLAO|nr:hypothetical protein [Spongiivirga citrea]NER15875.1 hypothetical protein [Spongiivirga citrea]